MVHTRIILLEHATKVVEKVFEYRVQNSATGKSQCSTAVRTVVRATQQVNGKWPFSGCQYSVTPEPIDYKFDTRDYVGEMTSYAKFHKFRRLKG